MLGAENIIHTRRGRGILVFLSALRQCQTRGLAFLKENSSQASTPKTPPGAGIDSKTPYI